MIYISIPVHEKQDVIVNQMQNFAKYFPEAMVILHLSKGANFSLDELRDALYLNKLNNVILNPTQVETQWGAIIQAHLENIRYAITLGNAEKIIFHSSNDMLVKSGVYNYVKDKFNIFHQRKCTLDSLWWVSKRALKDSNITRYFDDCIIASQIEGSMYEIALLQELIAEIDSENLQLESSIFYPREEIIFSSFAKQKNILPDGLPYLFSEIHQFDRKFFSILTKYNFIFKAPFYLGKLMVQLIQKLLLKTYGFQINKSIIQAIRQDDEKYLKPYTNLNDNKHLIWDCYKTRNLFAVKRVNREINDPIRQYITLG